jgi:hypothetical protein
MGEYMIPEKFLQTLSTSTETAAGENTRTQNDSRLLEKTVEKYIHVI